MTETSANKAAWAALEAEEDHKYAVLVGALDPNGSGITLTCPNCCGVSTVWLPQRRYGVNPLQMACPYGCGHYGDASSFGPTPHSPSTTFDKSDICRRDGTLTSYFGAIYRCPICAYENPREIMRNLTHSVRLEISQDRDKLADLLARVVSTFDGVMRHMNRIAVHNANAGGLYPIHPVDSFQNLAAARNKMLPHWDMKNASADWDAFVRLFQKRHCISHTLGVADQKYIDKSGDTEAVVGRAIGLTTQEVIGCAEDAERIVARFFAAFLS